ncbi:MAG TPA: ABC transporter permease [Chryseolinea sp.]
MLKHYWNTAFRNLLRWKLFTFINIAGLSISIAIFLSLTAYVRYQFSFDKFYKDGDRVYRIDYHEYQGGQALLQSARTHDRTALLVHEYVPQVEAVTRVYNEKAFVFTENVRIVDQDMLYVDSSFLKVFDVEVVKGSIETSLTPPSSVMISESQAKVYFGNDDPMGKVVYFNERLPFTITGVFKDIPNNSSLDFDFLLSWSTMPYYGWISKDGDFSSPWTFTYVKLKPNVTDLAAVNDGLTAMATKHITSLERRQLTAKLSLRPYEDLHTAEALSGEAKPAVSKTLLFSLISLAVFILVAAWINYINLSLARSLERADEIGVRKVFGASRMAISGQFILEALILSTITFAIGLGLKTIFTGPLAHLIFTNAPQFSNDVGETIFNFAGFVLVTTLVAFYPALFISRFKPVLIMKSKVSGGSTASRLLQHGLMVFQLFLAIAIIGITLVASRQLNFMRDFNSGFNSTHTIALRAGASTNSDSSRYERYMSFRNDALRNAGLVSGTASFNIPGQEIRFHDEGVHAVGSMNDKKQSFWVMWVDDGYQETFGLSVVAGRNFNEKEPGPTCMINEKALAALGYKSAVDAVNTTLITADQKKYTIIGVLKDYHHESIHKPVDPILFFHRHPFEYGYISFKVESRQANYLTTLQKLWNVHYPNDPFMYYFLDSFYEEQYRSDELFSTLLNLFSIIAIAVASLGLFGMATLAMVKRTKEIAVRKVLGATASNILVMLSGKYVRLIVLSCIIAFPVAYYLTSLWLDGFAHKINVSWWMIVLPGAFVLVTILLTIASQSLRAALANPAKSLRDQ